MYLCEFCCCRFKWVNKSIIILCANRENNKTGLRIKKCHLYESSGDTKSRMHKMMFHFNSMVLLHKDCSWVASFSLSSDSFIAPVISQLHHFSHQTQLLTELLKDDLKSPKSQRPGFGFIKRPCGALRESLSRSTGASSAELSCTCACTAISCLNYLWGSCVNAWALIYLARPDTQSAGINGNICVGGPAL